MQGVAGNANTTQAHMQCTYNAHKKGKKHTYQEDVHSLPAYTLGRQSYQNTEHGHQSENATKRARTCARDMQPREEILVQGWLHLCWRHACAPINSVRAFPKLNPQISLHLVSAKRLPRNTKYSRDELSSGLSPNKGRHTRKNRWLRKRAN